MKLSCLPLPQLQPANTHITLLLGDREPEGMISEGLQLEGRIGRNGLFSLDPTLRAEEQQAWKTAEQAIYCMHYST